MVQGALINPNDEFAILLLASEDELKKRIADLRRYLQSFRGKYINVISVALGYATVAHFLSTNIRFSVIIST
jgi:hypothetical protein